VLWYKAWLETRSRFLASLCGITIFVSLFLNHIERVLSPAPVRDTYYFFFVLQHYLMGLWMLAAVLLAMGGLIRERAAGVSSLTLALPVGRARLVGVQIASGVFETILLAVIPWGAMLLTTRLNGRPFPIVQAAFYSLLLVSGGLIYFALAVLISSLIEGEYTAPAVAYGLVIGSGVTLSNWDSLRPYADIWRFMGGDDQLKKSTFLLSGPFPWMGVLASLSVATMLLLASVVVIRNREF
jgi:ABC-type transport system involved in multi-copper enzyme maturation permease subunit